MAIDILRAMRTPPPPLDFVLPGMLAGTVGAIVSPGGAGKSMLALELGVLVATGLDLTGLAGGEKYPTGKVVVLAAEDPADALVHRIHALGAHIDEPTREVLAESMTIEPLAGKGPDLSRQDWIEYIRALASSARILILDTLRRFHVMDENDSGEMALLISILEAICAATGCAILFIHHTSKSAALNGQGDAQQASRGSSVLVDNIRWQMFLSKMSKSEAEAAGVDEAMRDYWVRAGVSKQNYGPPIAPVWLRRVQGGVLVPGVIGSGWTTTKKPTQSKGANKTEGGNDNERW